MTAVTSLQTAARRFQVGMHVDRAWRDHPGVTAGQYAVLVAATSKGQGRTVTARLSTIAAALGRTSDRAGDQVSAVLVHLEELGAVERSRTRRGAGVTRLKIHRAAGGYDVIPWELMRAVEARAVEPGVLRTWAHLSEKLGAYGWTHDTRSELAKAANVTSRTLLKHLAQLEDIGLITRNEGSRRAIVRAGATYTPAPEGELVHSASPDVTNPREGGVADSGSPHVADSGSIELAPDDSLTPDLSLSSRSDRHLGEREAHATSGRKRPSRGGIYEVEGINDVAELLQTDPAWRHGIRSQWTNGILAQAVHPALEDGLAPDAIAHALLTDAEILEMAELQQPLVRAAQAAITALRIDIRDYERCRDCGRSRNELDDADLIERRCGWCHEQHHPDAAGISEDVLQEVYAHLGAGSESLTNQPVAVIGAADTEPETTDPNQETENLTPATTEATQGEEEPMHTHTSTCTIEHGDYRCYVDHGCRRPECREAWRIYGSTRSREIAYGRIKVDHYVTGSVARAHIERLIHAGMSIRGISRECGVAVITISRIRAGHRIRTTTQDKLLTVVPEPPEATEKTPGAQRVDGAGTRRRLRALVAQGWTAVRLAQYAGCTSENLRQALSKDEGDQTLARFALQVRDLYEQLWDQTPPCASGYEEAQASRVRKEALDREWAPPMAWDEESIDDPAASPAEWREVTDLGSGRRRIHLDNLDDCATWGLDIEGAAQRLDVTADAICACAKRAERLDVLDRLRANGVERSVA